MDFLIGSVGESIDPLIRHSAVLGVALVAAATDVRKGIIPNWLTFPAILGAPIVYGVLDGAGALIGSLLGMLVCAVVPLLIWYRNGMAAGDVKVFAAIGAIGGYAVGLEVEFLALIVAAIYALGQLVWNGKLLSSLLNSFFIAANPVLPRRMRREIPPALMHRIRLGAAVFYGGAIAIAGEHHEIWTWGGATT